MYRGHKTRKCHHYTLVRDEKTFIKWKLLCAIHDDLKKDEVKYSSIIMSYSLLLLTEFLYQKSYPKRDLKLFQTTKNWCLEKRSNSEKNINLFVILMETKFEFIQKTLFFLRELISYISEILSKTIFECTFISHYPSYTKFIIFINTFFD